MQSEDIGNLFFGLLLIILFATTPEANKHYKKITDEIYFLGEHKKSIDEKVKKFFVFDGLPLKKFAFITILRDKYGIVKDKNSILTIGLFNKAFTIVNSSKLFGIFDNDRYKDKLYEKKGNVVVSFLDGLMWQDTSSVEKLELNWKDAVKYCENLQIDEYYDWRLPTIEELKTIVVKKRKPSIVAQFKFCADDIYWSSTTHINYTSGAWFINFYDGLDLWHSKSAYRNVRCVRSGK